MRRLYLIAFIILLLLNCQYFNLLNYNEWQEASGNETEYIVYSAGVYQDGTQIACYWKNEKRYSLDGESSGINALATSIYVADDNIYVGGGYHTTFAPQACYWKNGKIHYIDLEVPGNPSCVNSISVKNGVVFMAGYEDNDACYWINNKKYNLYVPNPSNSSNATSIYITQNTSSMTKLYIAGRHMPGAQNQACQWTDGGTNFISSGIDDSEANSIFVYEDTVYTAGIENGNACHWKNNNIHYYSTTSFGSYIFISTDGDIHLAAYSSGPSSLYWKNGNLKHSNFDREVYAIYVFSDDVYIAGQAMNSGFRAAYWKDKEIPIFVDDNGNVGSRIYSLFVKLKK